MLLTIFLVPGPPPKRSLILSESVTDGGIAFTGILRSADSTTMERVVKVSLLFPAV